MARLSAAIARKLKMGIPRRLTARNPFQRKPSIDWEKRIREIAYSQELADDRTAIKITKFMIPAA